MDTMTPIAAFHAAKKRNITENTQTHGGAGLMRYNSAPSSVLAGFLHIQDFFDEPIPHVDNVSELTRLLSPAIADEFCMSNTPLDVNPAEVAKGCGTAYESCSVNIPQNTRSMANITSGGLVDPNRTATQCPPYGCHKSRTTGHLSSIFEHTRDDPCSTVQKTQLDTGNYVNSEFSAPKPAMPISVSTSFGQPLLATTTKTSLIRHSSFPAEILSTLGMEECSESPTPRFTRDTHMQAMSSESMPHVVTHIPNGLRRGTHISHENISSTHFPLGQLESGRPFPANGSSFPSIQNSFNVTDDRSVVIVKTRSMELSPSSTQTSLFRQSSSPAGLLSQLSFDGTASASCEKVLPFLSSGSSSEEDRRGGVSRFLSRISGFWEEAGSGMSQRKRGRDTEGKIDDGLCVPIHKSSVEEEALQWGSGGHTETSSGSLLSMDDSVLCRTRAKRGCATHPRSIAERVRRTKISEGMRKLQELVPNMEKQTNTATMLDEAVEYVKFLQQQVQMLSESQAKCNGMCHLKGNT